MKIVNAKVYELNELDSTVREQVLNNSSQFLVDGDWFTPIVEGFNEKMAILGLSNPETFFSGFWSQGDGACFICNEIDTDLLIRTLHEQGFDIPEDCLLYSKDLSVSIAKLSSSFSSQYDHERTIASAIHSESESIRQNDLILLENVLTEWARETSKLLYKDLEKYYTELTSDESVIESLEGCLFFADGKIANGYIFTEAVEASQDSPIMDNK